MSVILINAGLSFLTAGLWISLSTWVAERLGTKTGGVVALLPSTVLVSLLFVAFTMGSHFAAEAALTVPLGMAINSIFLLVFVAIANRGLLTSISLSLLIWALLALFFRWLNLKSMLIILTVFLAVVVTAYRILEHVLNVESISKREQPFRISTLLYRALFAGSIVAFTVVISKVAGHFWTGIFSTFPAVMLTSMVILTRAQGIDFAKATAKTMILASGNIVVYALAVSMLYPKMGLLVGTFIAFSLSVVFLIMILPILRRSR